MNYKGKIIILLLTFLITKTVSGQICHPQLFTATEDGLCNDNPYVLVFEDNFDGDSLDVSKWKIQPWGQGSLTGDNSQQYYSLDNVTVSSGICTITAKHETVIRKAVNWIPDTVILSDGLPNLRTYYYTSSNIWTTNKFGHGMYEIRCRIPSGKGFWPAFWMYGTDSASNSEIDGFEFWDDNTVKHHMTVHHNGQMCESDYTGPDFSSAFHTFRVTWTDYKIEWYVDSVLKRRITKFNSILGQNVDCDGVLANTLYILEKSFPTDSVNIIMNLAIQTGTYAPDTNTPFPGSLEIDYIRYYKQLPFTGMETLTDTTLPSDEPFKINTFPNPNSSILTIEFKENLFGNYKISLLDEQGKTVYKSTSLKEGIIYIDISGYARGVYVLQVLDTKNKNDYIHKIIFN
ncbi:MAG: family 16 glycosylhydrolase [Bacteroidetes bacterium]|nr:family 16 glycosylhydrolase [Bacteroidota bacterium]